jgi:hypothetical protein
MVGQLTRWAPNCCPKRKRPRGRPRYDGAFFKGRIARKSWRSWLP